VCLFLIPATAGALPHPASLNYSRFILRFEPSLVALSVKGKYSLPLQQQQQPQGKSTWGWGISIVCLSVFLLNHSFDFSCFIWALPWIEDIF